MENDLLVRNGINNCWIRIVVFVYNRSNSIIGEREMLIEDIMNKLKVKRTAEFIQCPRCGVLEYEFELHKYLDPLHCPHCGFVFEKLHTKEELEEMYTKWIKSTLTDKRTSFKKYCEFYGLIDISTVTNK